VWPGLSIANSVRPDTVQGLSCSARLSTLLMRMVMMC
jgi:hypothetical protein